MVTTVNYSFDDLKKLWEQAGGPAAAADVAAAIALAESSGNPSSVSPRNADGTVDQGLWQINSSHNTWATNPLDPLSNAQYAVQLYNGAKQTFSDWVAYNNGSYLTYLPGGTNTAQATPAPGTGTNYPTDTSIAQVTADQQAQQEPWYKPILTNIFIGAVLIGVLYGGFRLLGGGDDKPAIIPVPV